MKQCAFCGTKNEEAASVCAECGEELTGTVAEAPVRWERVAVLGSEVEAERLEVELQNQDIPHVLVSYRDSALDGLYQLSRGWGQVEAPPQHKEAVLAILQDIRQSGEEAQTEG
jgi:hypothetical protein